MKMMIGSNLSADQLRSVIERIEKLMEEKAAIAADIRDVFAQAKGNGYDVPAIRKIIKLRSMDAGKRDEEEAVLDTYMRAIGMKPLPLFEDEEDAA
jgi:uncharacterized protein (UPF0335 family)